jgi:hypothetical protein
VVNPTSIPILRKNGWSSGPVWTGTEKFTAPKFRTTNCLAQVEYLYRLRYPGQYNYGKYFRPTFLIHNYKYKNAKSGKSRLMDTAIFIVLVFYSRTGCINRNSPNSIGRNSVYSCNVKQTSSNTRVTTLFSKTEGPAKLCLLLLANQ